MIWQYIIMQHGFQWIIQRVCVYNQNRYSFQRAAQSLLWLCEAFSFVCRTGNIFNSSGSGCRFCSELWWVRFQKIPGLRIDCFIFWDAFTLPILFHPPANRRCPHYASSHKQQSCGMGESALHNSSSTGAHLPTRSLHVWTTAILVSLRSSDLTAILDYFKQAAQKQIYTTSLSLYMLYCTPSSSQHPV